MPCTLPLSQPTAKPTTTPATAKATATATATTRTQHTYTPSPHLYIHLTYHASASASTPDSAVVDPITLRQALTAALRQHHGQHGAAIPIDILYVGASAPSASSSSSSSSSFHPAPSLATHIMTHTIVRAPLADGAAVVGACGAWVGETTGGSSSGGGRMAAAGAREEEEAARSRWVVRGWDAALARLVLGDGKELFG